LAIITQALSKLDIDLSIRSIVQDPIPLRDLQSLTTIQNAVLPLTADAIPLGNAPFELDETLQMPPLHNFNPDGFEISPEMLEAFLSLEPIDATVGALHDFD
jgi:hypothetical protein